MSFSRRSPDAAEYLLGPTGQALERFFDPFNEMLANAIGDEFRWRRKDHWARELNESEKEAGRQSLEEAKRKREESRARSQRSKADMARRGREWASRKKAGGEGRR
jgi:hypothetical protein